MCVKQAMGNRLREGDLSMAAFKAIEPALPGAESLVLNGIGEPLLHPRLEEFIQTAKRLMPASSWVGFQTNGLLLDEGRARSLVDAGVDRICLSLDSIHPDTFQRLREGGDVKGMEKAFSALGKARKANPGSILRIGVEFVVMKDNAHQLPDVLRWSAARGATFAIVTNLIAYDEDHVAQAAYDSSTGESLEIFRAWREKADREGLDLTRYSKLLWKGARTPGEQRIVDLVHGMTAEARSRDVFLHVENLLQRDESFAEELAGVFAQAEAVAEEVDLELTLPARAPASDRNCRFMDEGAVFISWDGKVHSCYFLWHTFLCHFPGRRKHVKPRSFGDLREQGLLEIWNSPSYRAFRKEALAKDYPYCSNCNLLPCEYIYSEEFEQDCFASTVPCGDCFWCTGLYQCLS